jgi:hypothetical protein
MRRGTAASTFGPSFLELIAATDDLRVAEVDAGSRRRHCLHPGQDRLLSTPMVQRCRCHDSQKAASTHVEKLRIIVLFHALFNMLNKRVAKKATEKAMAKHVIPSEIAAKQGHRAVNCGLNKVLTADIV